MEIFGLREYAAYEVKFITNYAETYSQDNEVHRTGITLRSGVETRHIVAGRFLDQTPKHLSELVMHWLDPCDDRKAKIVSITRLHGFDLFIPSPKS